MRITPGQRILIWGFGRHGGGHAAARFCRSLGAHVSILDAKPPTAFGPEASDYAWHVGDGAHPVLQQADLIVASPAIPPRAWPARHPPATCPEGLFFAHHRGRRVAVTGTKGKSTTARIAGALLGWPVAGNSYEPLLDLLLREGPAVDVVCELSSFQLWYLRDHKPQIDAAILTLLTRDHLDWHPDLDHYRQAKLALLRWSQVVAAAPQASPLLPPGLPLLPAEPAPASLAIPGPHNRANAALAIAVARHLGVATTDIASRLSTVRPLPHRLATVHTAHGVAFVDDSIATTPEAAIAALASFDGPLAIILGGSDKGADFAELAAAVRQRGVHPVLLGATAPRLAAAGIAAPVAHDLDDAIHQAHATVADANGGTVLLSPACASFDLFRGFEDRGDRFAEAARRLFPA
jgi:UDP-N-acetylmuramoylalanine--D-glutamate ligase